MNCETVGVAYRCLPYWRASRGESSVQQERAKTCLLEVAVPCERFCDAFAFHGDEGYAVRQGPSLVRPARVKVDPPRNKCSSDERMVTLGSFRSSVWKPTNFCRSSTLANPSASSVSTHSVVSRLIVDSSEKATAFERRCHPRSGTHKRKTCRQRAVSFPREAVQVMVMVQCHIRGKPPHRTSELSPPPSLNLSAILAR